MNNIRKIANGQMPATVADGYSPLPVPRSPLTDFTPPSANSLIHIQLHRYIYWRLCGFPIPLLIYYKLIKNN